jgi:hypothetical protein
MRLTIYTAGDPSVGIQNDEVYIDFGDGSDPTDGDRSERQRLASSMIEALAPYLDGKPRARFDDECEDCGGIGGHDRLCDGSGEEIRLDASGSWKRGA